MDEDARRRRYAWKRHPVFRFFASTPLAIVLIVVISVVLVWGTVLGARTSLRVALHSVYGGIWFQGLLGLLALNLLCCTLRALPYRLSHLGFLVTHLSLLLVYAGAVLTINFGAQGTVVIVEGRKTDFYFDPAFVQCTDASSGEAINISTTFEKRAALLQERYDGIVHARANGPGGVSVLVDRYYPDASPAGTSTITFTIPEQNVREVVPAIADPDKIVPIGKTGSSVTVERTFYDWKDGREAGTPQDPGNPAAQIVVHRPGGDEALTLFARFPGFSMRPEATAGDFSATYTYVSESPELLGWEAKDSVIRLTLTDEEGNRVSAWVPYFERREVALGARRFVIEYGRRVPLGFELVLDTFIAKHYPRSNIPAAFESHLTVRNQAGGERHAVAAMNAPAKIGGYVLYQSSYGTDTVTGLPYTVLSLSRDPGTALLYVGFATLTAGLIVTFYVSPWLRRRDRKRHKESP